MVIIRANRSGSASLWVLVGLLLYAMAAWVVLQIVESVVSALTLPSWINAVTVVVAMLGLPFAGVWAWKTARRRQELATAEASSVIADHEDRIQALEGQETPEQEGS